MSGTERLNSALDGRYKIEKQLGQGGMATVYLAKDIKHDRMVAVKVLKPELAAVLGAERFVVEIKTTAALQHPHILPLFDSGTADGFLYYVMPYIEGETLRGKLNRETQFSVDEAVRITAQIADALDYAHRHGVIHRDIKPENILLHDGRPMVADFGIALAVSAAAGGRMTETGLSLGTPHYMSPEQATAEKEITGKSDIYSLASMTYEMLTGNPPHMGSSAQQIIMKIIAEPVESVTKFRKAVPPNVAAAVAQALEKLPADRFETAKGFAEALLNRTFTSAHFAGDAGPGHRSRVTGHVFSAAVSIAVVATIAAAWGWLRPAPHSNAINRLTLQLPDSQAMSDGSAANRLAISPDGRTIVYVGGSIGGQTRLWVRPMDQLRGTPIPGTEGGMNPAFSPDGKNIAFTFTGGRRAIKRVSLAGGPALTLTDSLVDLGGLTWAEDGYLYYDGHLTGDGVARVKETGGLPEIATTPDVAKGETYHFMPRALPDGRGVLFVITRGGVAAASDIAVLDLRTKQRKVLTRGLMATYAASGHLVYVVDGGALMAAPFNLDKLEITGDAVGLANNVSVRGNSRADLVVADDGTLLFASGQATSARRELVWVSRDGKVEPVDPTWIMEFGGRPALAPAGRFVAIAAGPATARQVWVKELDRGPASRVTEFGGGPAWSPDGKTILFSTQAQAARVPVDGSALPTQVRAAAGSQYSYTPDGKGYVFQSNGDIYYGAFSDTASRLLVQDQGVQSGATVSPDGRWLAYSSDETGMIHVYVRPFPNTQAAKRLVSVTGGGLARWSRDGRELFYIDPTNIDLLAVPVVPGAGFATGLPKRLFSALPFTPTSINWFDVTRDGRRFLFTRAIGSAVERLEELVLVQNFFEELKAKVRPK